MNNCSEKVYPIFCQKEGIQCSMINNHTINVSRPVLPKFKAQTFSDTLALLLKNLPQFQNPNSYCHQWTKLLCQQLMGTINMIVERMSVSEKIFFRKRTCCKVNYHFRHNIIDGFENENKKTFWKLLLAENFQMDYECFLNLLFM